ncbi:MAG: hypothetical protein ACOCWM_04580 [Cyclobacteriaceae bacterium]
MAGKAVNSGIVTRFKLFQRWILTRSAVRHLPYCQTVISNSIHAINEARKTNQLKKDDKIEIKLIRNGDEKTLSEFDFLSGIKT